MTDQNTPNDESSLVQRFRRRTRDRRVLYPGITRGDAFLYGTGVLVYTLLICAMSFILIMVLNNRSAQEAAELAAAQREQVQLTAVQETRVAEQETREAQATQNVINATETAIARITPTSGSVFDQLIEEEQPTPTPTVETEATLPPPPSSLPGVIAGWGGRNPASNTFLTLQLYDPTTPDSVTPLSPEFARQVSADNSLQHILYFALDTRTSDELIYRYDMTAGEGARNELLEQRWNAAGFVEPVFPAMSRGGQFMAFIARAVDNNRSPEIYRYDFVNDQLLRMTNDEFAYEGLAISADGSRLATMQIRPDGSQRDLVLLEAPSEVPSGVPDLISVTTIRELTTDDDEQLEYMPSFSADGSQILYTVTAPNDPENHDIYLLTILEDGTIVPPITLIGGPDDEVYPAFSPDGQYIAFASDMMGAYDIYIENISTTERFQLTRTDNAPDFPGAWVTGESDAPAATPAPE